MTYRPSYHTRDVIRHERRVARLCRLALRKRIRAIQRDMPRVLTDRPALRVVEAYKPLHARRIA